MSNRGSEFDQSTFYGSTLYAKHHNETLLYNSYTLMKKRKKRNFMKIFTVMNYIFITFTYFMYMNILIICFVKIIPIMHINICGIYT
jgi:hypothetical protein